MNDTPSPPGRDINREIDALTEKILAGEPVDMNRVNDIDRMSRFLSSSGRIRRLNALGPVTATAFAMVVVVLILATVRWRGAIDVTATVVTDRVRVTSTGDLVLPLGLRMPSLDVGGASWRSVAMPSLTRNGISALQVVHGELVLEQIGFGGGGIVVASTENGTWLSVLCTGTCTSASLSFSLSGTVVRVDDAGVEDTVRVPTARPFVATIGSGDRINLVFADSIEAFSLVRDQRVDDVTFTFHDEVVDGFREQTVLRSGIRSGSVRQWLGDGADYALLPREHLALETEWLDVYDAVVDGASIDVTLRTSATRVVAGTDLTPSVLEYLMTHRRMTLIWTVSVALIALAWRLTPFVVTR